MGHVKSYSRQLKDLSCQVGPNANNNIQDSNAFNASNSETVTAVEAYHKQQHCAKLDNNATNCEINVIHNV